MSEIRRVALLAGGTGGAKLAAGMQGLLSASLSVVANTGDDLEFVGIDVSPDPDLITYWLCGEIDEQRGWGIAGDTFTTFDRLAALGAPAWFRISDRDLATCLYRGAFVAEGGTRTQAQAQIAGALGVSAQVLPMSEQPVRTRVRTPAGWRSLQEFLVADGAQGPVEEVAVDGLDAAQPTPEVLEALETADAIVIGPSNPVISIGPILGIEGIREAIARSSAPVVAVSPLLAGHAVKGPTEEFMRALGKPLTAAGVASLYEGLLDGLVCDENDPGPAPEGPEVLACPTLMEGPEGRRALAERVLGFAAGLRTP